MSYLRICAVAMSRLWDTIRPLFHWKISQVFIPLWFAIGVEMALENRFVLSYGFFVLFTIWSTLCWFASDTLAKKQSGIEKLRKKALKKNAQQSEHFADYEKAQRIHFFCYKIGVPTLLIVLMGICLLGVNSSQIDYRLHLPFGVLIPASDLTPPNPCDSASGNALRILLGPMASAATIFPTQVLALGGNPILSFNRNADGNISITTDVYDQNGDIVVEIKDNHFRVANDAFDVIHPDFSSLAVIIRHNKERVLDIRYLNPLSIRVLGTFRHPNAPVLEIRESSLVQNGQAIPWNHVCFENSGAVNFGFTKQQM